MYIRSIPWVHHRGSISLWNFPRLLIIGRLGITEILAFSDFAAHIYRIFDSPISTILLTSEFCHHCVILKVSWQRTLAILLFRYLSVIVFKAVHYYKMSVGKEETLPLEKRKLHHR